MKSRFTKSENIHIVLWLIKDMSWLMSWKLLGLAMIIPTFVVSIIITRRSRHIQEDLWLNIAVCFWICANGTWMVGEFYFADTWRTAALVFFILGISTLGIYYSFIVNTIEE